jgi:hypothetical protein
MPDPINGIAAPDQIGVASTGQGADGEPYTAVSRAGSDRFC